ncbi:hypothetical protein NQZ68_019345 [Dissostichus eleginoides]|nr:hypothetical protein NQZ68_019345 [Dissostichus eleginoides]
MGEKGEGRGRVLQREAKRFLVHLHALRMDPSHIPVAMVTGATYLTGSPADQTGVHPDDVSPGRLLLGTFVVHNAQVFVAASENQQERKHTTSQSELVCVF